MLLGQSSHTVLPVEAVYLPAAHLLQMFPPAVPLYLPASHCTQLNRGPVNPGEHWQAELEVLLAGEVAPEAQLVHVVAAASL